MLTPFSRTLRTLSSDRSGLSLAMAGLTALLIAGWACWLALGRVTLLEVTENARLEVATAIAPLEAPVAGRVIRSHLTIGRPVEEGEVLVELDAEPERLELREQTARLAGLAAESERLWAQMRAEENTRQEERRSAEVAVAQAAALEREALAPAEFTAHELDRLTELRRLGLIAERDYARGRAEAEKHRAAAAGSRIAIQRVEQDQRTRDSDREARILRLRAEITAIEGQMRALQAALERLRYEAGRRLVRAPSSGRIGEAKELRPGAVLAQGDRLAAIVPDGRLRIVAFYPPTAAAGRLHPGQPARMRLHGFPWTQYGLLEAQVTRVAGEIRDGLVRVELATLPGSSFRAPLQHGMPGSLEVAVETVAPAVLALRLAGRHVTQPLATRPAEALELAVAR